MNSTLKSFKSAPAGFLVALGIAAFFATGCAGSKKSSGGGDYSSLGSSSEAAPDAPSQKVEDARRSAEEAEQKAHELRMEKAKAQAKSSAE